MTGAMRGEASCFKLHDEIYLRAKVINGIPHRCNSILIIFWAAVAAVDASDVHTSSDLHWRGGCKCGSGCCRPSQHGTKNNLQVLNVQVGGQFQLKQGQW